MDVLLLSRLQFTTTAAKLWPVELGVAVIFLIASFFATRLYDNYLANPILFVIILLAVAGFLGIKVFLTKKELFKAWFASALTIVAATFYGVVGLFPNMFPSNIDPSFSLTAHNAASSDLTLKIMQMQMYSTSLHQNDSMTMTKSTKILTPKTTCQSANYLTSKSDSFTFLLLKYWSTY